MSTPEITVATPKIRRTASATINTKRADVISLIDFAASLLSVDYKLHNAWESAQQL
jgi:hypothetical protein